MSSGFDVAERARKEMQEIGGKCGNNNKYTHWYSDNVENIGYNFWWCAAFVSYVVRPVSYTHLTLPTMVCGVCKLCCKTVRCSDKYSS